MSEVASPSFSRITVDSARDDYDLVECKPDFDQPFTHAGWPPEFVTANPVFVAAAAANISVQGLISVPVEAALITIAAKLSTTVEYLESFQYGWMGVRCDVVTRGEDSRRGWADGAVCYRELKKLFR